MRPHMEIINMYNLLLESLDYAIPCILAERKSKRYSAHWQMHAGMLNGLRIGVAFINGGNDSEENELAGQYRTQRVVKPSQASVCARFVMVY